MWNFLEWPNRFEGELTQNLVLDGDYNPVEFPDQDTEIQIVLSISLAQFTKLYSSIVKGAILSYPDEYEQIAWSFLKAFEMPYDICQIIADCINNPESPARQAVKELVINDTDITQHILNISTTGGPMTGPQIEALIGDECDEDAAFGGWSALIRQMDANNRDLFERIEVGTNTVERTNLAISALPGIGILPVDELFGFFDELLDNLVENYAAQWTTTLEDELRCDLFCLALDNDCGLNFDQVFTYFNNRLSASFTVESLLLDILSFIGAGSWSGTQIVDAMMLLQVAILRASSTFIDFPVYSLQTTYTLGLNDPDPDWSTLCECGGWEHTFPDAGGWSAFTLETFDGAITTESGGKLIGATNTTNDAVFVNAKITVDADVQNVSFTIEWSGPSLAGQAFNLYIDTVLVESLDLNALTSPATLSYPAGETGSHEYEILGGVTGSTAGGKFLNVTASVWSGDGDDPFA